jgi:SAM-dependent methyltransferase
MNCHTREDAQNFPRGDLSLDFCRGCGFIWNTRFDPAAVRYSPECEESQGYSLKFSSFAKDLAQYLVNKYEVKGKAVIEIGCGKGEFLKHICTLGKNTGTGFDPAFVPGRKFEHDVDDDIEFIADYYSEKYSSYKGDLICCRMTLEHISDPDRLIATIRKSIGDREDVITFFQVPDVTRILKDCSIEDIYYEHCSYFSPGSLSRLFQKNGFKIIDLKTVFDEQYLLLVAKPNIIGGEASHSLENIENIDNLVSTFETNLPKLLQYWDDQFTQFKKQKKKVIIWGGGSKGVAFLHAIRQSDIISYVVDINPYRQQTFMAGSGQRIISPSYLKEYRPDVVLIMNAIYREEIQNELHRMDLNPFVKILEKTNQSMIDA